MPYSSPLQSTSPFQMQNPQLRKMERGDVHRAIKIIAQHDEDDAEVAHEDLQEDMTDQYVLVDDEDTVVGLTGFRRVPATDNTAWLSWTYLHEDLLGKGHGKFMLSSVLNIMRQEDMRMVCVKVSNYIDPDDGPVYESAFSLYQKLGFTLALTNIDFYDDGEDQRILSLQLQQDDADFSAEVQDEKATIRFNGLYEIAETEGAYSFSWIVKDKRAFFEKRSFSVEDLLIGLKSVKDEGGRRVFLTFPSNLPLIHQPLQGAGFKFVGELKDYYELGVHELHFVHSLEHLPS